MIALLRLTTYNQLFKDVTWTWYLIYLSTQVRRSFEIYLHQPFQNSIQISNSLN